LVRDDFWPVSKQCTTIFCPAVLARAGSASAGCATDSFYGCFGGSSWVLDFFCCGEEGDCGSAYDRFEGKAINKPTARFRNAAVGIE